MEKIWLDVKDKHMKSFLEDLMSLVYPFNHKRIYDFYIG